MAAEGLITFDKLRAKLAALEDTRETAKRELKAVRRSTERAAELERDKDALLKRVGTAAPGLIERATPETRCQAYRMLRLSVAVRACGALEVAGTFTDVLGSENTSRSISERTRSRSGR